MKPIVAALILSLAPVTVQAGEPQAQAPVPASPEKAKAAPKAGKPAAAKRGKGGPPASAAAPIPPAVLTGDGDLICDISAKENGHQKLVIVNGGGLEFDVAVSPIVDGTVTTAGPEKGGSYRFTSHLAKPAKGTLPGVGEFDLDELETKVMVEMTRYKQPAGKGTALTFTSKDMARRGIYVEFAGRGHAKNGENYSFRVNLGAPSDGGGRVVPADDNIKSNVAAKMVSFRAPTTTVLITTTVDRTPP
jgi:hypothetical protein